MKNKVYIYDKEQGKVVPIEEKTQKEHFHVVITDEMDGAQHPCDGLYYTSKSNFRKTTQAHGCVEIGNETQSTSHQDLNRSERVEDIRRAMHETGMYKG